MYLIKTNSAERIYQKWRANLKTYTTSWKNSVDCEARLPTKPKYKLEPGRSYLVKEKEPKRSAEWFRDVVSHGTAGVWVTSQPPRKLERKQGLVKTLIISVAAKPVRRKVTVRPDELKRARGIFARLFRKSSARGRSPRLFPRASSGKLVQKSFWLPQGPQANLLGKKCEPDRAYRS